MALILRPPGSQESLTDRLSELGRTRKRVAVASGLFTLIAVVTGSIAAAGILDAAIGLPSLLRALALVSILVTGGVFWIRGISRPLAIRTGPLSVALELEERYPTLNDALASAVTFLSDDAEQLGVSNRLQKVVVNSAQRLVDRNEFESLIPSGACWRAGWLCTIALAAMIPLVLANSNRAYVALLRLADPFGTHPWPTKTRIEILSPVKLPTRVPRGEPFGFKFVVRGVIKDRAVVEFKLNSGEEFQEQYPLADDIDAKASTTVSAEIDGGRLPTSFAFKVISNDCDTGWQNVEVAPPPRLIDLDGRPSPQFHYAPPKYTGLPEIDLPDGAVVLEIPVGTSVQMRAAVDMRLASATLSFQGDKTAIEKTAPLAAIGHLNPLSAVCSVPLAHDIGSDIPVALDGSGRRLSVSFIPAMSGMYILKMNDETGLSGSRLLDIRLTPDPAPVVAMQRPSVAKDPRVLTPSSFIPIHISADDKLYALRSVFLEYRIGRYGSVRKISLADVRDAMQVLPAVLGGAGATAQIRPTSAEIRSVVSVSIFRRDDGSPVREGDTLFIGGAADDWDDITLFKEPGRSGVVEIQIAAADEVEAWLQKELAGMYPELFRLRDTERESRQKTSDAVPLPDGTLTPIDRDKLLTAEQLQRQIRAKLTDPRDGLRAKAEVLRETVRANKLPISNTTKCVEAVADELIRIAERDLSPIENNLADARQIGGQPARAGQEQLVPELLKKAARHQKSVDDGLTNLLDLLAVWGGAAEIRGESRILRDQINRELEDGEKLREKVPAGSVLDSLSSQQKADLERAGGKAELDAERAGAILARAARLATEKDKQADAARDAATAKLAHSESLSARASSLPQGMPEKSTLNAQASALKGEAEDLKASADKAAAETNALRKGIDAAGGQTLPDNLRKAAEAIRNNRQTAGADLQRSAAASLGKLVDQLTEKPSEVAPDLAKLKRLANELNALADEQEKLRKRTDDASKILDPAKREDELKKLAAEQDKLLDRGKDILQRLVREPADAAARDTRNALDQMETSRDDLEKGKSGSRTQDDAIERLDTARDRIDSATNNAGERLSNEKRRKMADKIKALLERQKAAVSEADRIHGLVLKNKKWERPLLSSYADLEERERVLAAEVRLLSEKEFAPLPVLSRLLVEAAGAMDAASDKVKTRREDALDADPAIAFDPEFEAATDRKVKRPMALATRRLEQLLDALNEEPPKASPKKETQPAVEPKNPMPDNRGDEDIIPPLAQLKILKALQAELNQRTEEFAKEHKDKGKLTEEEIAELKELEQSQRDIANLFEQMAKLFQEHQQDQEVPVKQSNKEPEKSP
jgi:hypothetical protein